MALKNRSVNININARDKAAPKLGGLEKTLKRIKQFTVGSLGFIALKKVINFTSISAAETEKQMIKLKTAMVSAGRFSEDAFKRITAQAESLERSTGTTTEQIIQAQAVLQSFGRIGEEELKRATVAALDMSVVFNQDVAQSALVVGKAFVGQIAGMRKMGIAVTKAKIDAEGFDSVLKQLAIEFGGQAAARLQGFGGIINRIGIEFEQVGKEVGFLINRSGNLKTILVTVGDVLTDVVEFLRGYRGRTEDATGATIDYTEALKDEASALENVGKQHVITQQKIALSAAQTELGNRFKGAATEINNVNALIDEGGHRLDDYAKAGGAIRAELIRLVQQVRLEQKRLDDLLGDERVVKGYAKIKGEVKAVKSAVNDLGDTEDTIEQKAWRNLLARATLIQSTSDRRSVARARDLEEEIKVNEEKARIAKETNDIIAENEKALSNILDQIRKRDTDLTIDNAQKQIDAIQEINNRQLRRESEFLRDQLTKQNFNWNERGKILDEIEDKTEKVQDKIATGKMTPVDIENAITKMDAYTKSLKNVGGAEDTLQAVNETIKALFTEMERQAATGKGADFFKNIIDVEEAKSWGETLYDALFAGLKEQAQLQPPIEIKAQLKLTTEDSKLIEGFQPKG